MLIPPEPFPLLQPVAKDTYPQGIVPPCRELQGLLRNASWAAPFLPQDSPPLAHLLVVSHVGRMQGGEKQDMEKREHENKRNLKCIKGAGHPHFLRHPVLGLLLCREVYISVLYFK